MHYPRSAASYWSPLSLRGATAVIFSFGILLSAFAMFTTIAFYLFDVRVTTGWQDSTNEPPVQDGTAYSRRGTPGPLRE
jgi:hypothetical protein